MDKDDIPTECPDCHLPLVVSADGKVPGERDAGLAGIAVSYCPKCKTTWPHK